MLVGAKNGQAEETTFKMTNPLERPAGDKIVDPESMATLVKAALDESDEGELEIAIPLSIQAAVQQDARFEDKNGMVIRIFYELAEPDTGIHFVLPDEKAYPNRPAHAYSHNASGARCWMPCFDTPLDRCSWVLEFEVAADLTAVASGACPAQPQEILSKDNSHAHRSGSDSNASGVQNGANKSEDDGKKNVSSIQGHHASDTSSSGNNMDVDHHGNHQMLYASDSSSSRGAGTNTLNSSTNLTNPGSTGNTQNPKDVSLKRYTFVVTEPVLASSIGFAVGKFETSTDTLLDPGELSFYSLPGRSSLLENTVGFMGQSLKFFETLLHSPLPGKHLKVVFVDDAPTTVSATAGLMVCSTHLLHSQDIIDQTYITRHVMSVGLAMQWFPVLVDYKSVTDAWIISGIIGYLAYLNYQKMFGQSDFRALVQEDTAYVLQATRLAKQGHVGCDELPRSGSQADFITNTLFTQSLVEYTTHARHKKDKSRIDISLTERIGDSAYVQDVLIADCNSSLYYSNFISATEVNTKYYHKRSTLVMLQLEKLVSKEIMHQLMALLVRRDENTGLPAHQQLTARQFFKICKKSVQIDLGEFQDQWVHQHGLPHLQVGFQYHADSRRTEFVIKQDLHWCQEMKGNLTIRTHEGNQLSGSASDALGGTAQSSQSSSLSSSNAHGSTNASAHGASEMANSSNPEEDQPESTVEENSIPLEGEYSVYYTKPKTSSTGSSSESKSTRRKRAAAKKSGSSGSKKDANTMDDTDEEDDDEDDMMHSSAAEQQATKMQRARADLGYIRVDPDFEWIRQLSFHQAEYMWIAQLQHDRDVLAQFEGIEGLVRAAHSDAACVALHAVLSNVNNFYKVRMRAASALGVLATRFRRAFELLQEFFMLHYYDLPDTSSNQSTTTNTTATNSTVSTPGVPMSGISGMSASENSNPSTPANALASTSHTTITRPYTPMNTGSGNTMSQMELEDDGEEATLRPNDFSNFEAYFVQKAVMVAISTIRDERDFTPAEVLTFLFDLLNSNDNSRNAYSDNYYVAALFQALTNVRCEHRTNYMEIVKQSERYLGKELMMPCYHNVIAQSCLHLLATLQADGKLDIELNEFVRYFSYGNLPTVRAMAVRCFIRVGLCVAQTDAACDDVFSKIENILKNDVSIWFKHKTAYALATALESGVDLDPLLTSPKIDSWRYKLFHLINSKATAFSPRLRLLLLNALAALGGEKIAQEPKLPPRRVFPPRPMKADEIAAAQRRKLNFSAPASSRRPIAASSAQAHSQAHSQAHASHHANSNLANKSAGASTNSTSVHTPSRASNHTSNSSQHLDHAVTSTSERPQRRAAQRARVSEPDPLLDALGNEFFDESIPSHNTTKTPSVSIVLGSSSAAQQANISNVSNVPSSTAPASSEEAPKPRRFVFGKAKLSAATSNTPTTPVASTQTATEISNASPAPTPAPIDASPTQTTSIAPAVSVNASAEPDANATAATPVRRVFKIKSVAAPAVQQSITSSPSHTPSTTDATSNNPIADPTPTVTSSAEKVSVPETKPVVPSDQNVSQVSVTSSVDNSSSNPIPEVAEKANISTQISVAPSDAPPAQEEVKPVLKVGGPRFVLKRAAPSASQDADTSKKPKIEETEPAQQTPSQM